MSLLETNPTLATLSVHRDGLIGLKSGLDQAIDKIDRLITNGASLCDIGNAVLDGIQAKDHVGAKLSGMHRVLARQIAQDIAAHLKGSQCLTPFMDALQAHMDAEIAADPPPPLDDDDKIVPFRRRISHSGPVGGDGPRAA